MPPATEAELEAEAAAVDAASEALEERRLERAARHVLFDDLQREWSDATFLAERDRLERQDEEDEVAWARDGTAVGRRGGGPLGGLRLSTGGCASRSCADSWSDGCAFHCMFVSFVVCPRVCRVPG